jgi:ectoine hydroxylase-related dioxygenase (phytanoyl-CoA dioxygenase family)
MTAEQLESYAADGIVFPLRAIAAAEADRYCGLARAALAHDPEVEANPHLKCAWAHELATHAAIRAAADAILGDAAIWASMLLYKAPRSRGFVSWHQDGAYRDFAPGDVVSAWVALSEATAENGCMQVVRGSHRARLPHRDVPERDNMIRLGKHAEAAIDPAAVTNVVLKAGEMSLHHNDLLHGSRPNASDRPRLGFVVRFLKRGVPWSGPLV